jgi:hypothetical protein
MNANEMLIIVLLLAVVCLICFGVRWVRNPVTKKRGMVVLFSVGALFIVAIFTTAMRVIIYTQR